MKYSIKKRPTQMFFILRIAQAIAWIRMLLAGVIRDISGKAFTVQKWTSVATRAASLIWCVRTDASPYGMGAILFKFGTPVAWIAEEWSPDDYELLKATRGDPAWQAEWELLAVLIAIDTWLARLHSQAMCLVQTDATAALHDVMRMAGRTPAMNALTAELAASTPPTAECSNTGGGMWAGRLRQGGGGLRSPRPCPHLGGTKR